MLIVFKSKAAAEIIMYAEHAKRLLDIIGKDFEPAEAPRGIITAEQVPAALNKLKSAANAALAAKRATQNVEVEPDPGASISVSLAQRAYPLIDMLERAEKMQREVTWGV